MKDCQTSGGWTHVPPSTSGYYEVRPCLSAWDIGPEAEPPASRLTYVDPSSGRFDAGKFGGDIGEPLWEWRGPIEVPSHCP